MTREEIMRLEGRELDVVVAERIMGWKQVRWVNGIPVGQKIGIPFEYEYVVPEYSSDIAQGWQVIEIVRCLPAGIRRRFVRALQDMAGGLDLAEWLLYSRPDHWCRAALLAVCACGEENSHAQ